MSATHVLFVAWEKADEKTAEANAWAEFGNKKKRTIPTNYQVVIYKPGTESEYLKKLQTGQIYILGHGARGFHSIGDIDGDPDKIKINLLSAENVGDRLIESGLQTSFSGKIKCYNCDSSRTRQGNPGFAQVFADYMRWKKYSKCQYFGYDSSVSTAHEDKAFGGTHRHALYEMEKGRYVAIGRAKDKRTKL
jgi:hypothetical protein